MERNLGVIYILHSSEKHTGANKSFLAMLEGLVLRGVEPIVIIPSEGDIVPELAERNIRYYVVKCLLAIYPIRFDIKDTTLRDVILFIPRIVKVLLLNIIANKAIHEIAVKFKPDLIHTNVGPLHNGHTVAKRLKVPHIWHIREYQDLDFHFKPLFSKNGFIKKLRFRNNHPIAITEDIFRHFSLNKKAAVIYNGIFKAADTQFRKEKKQYFLFAGRLEPAKGILDLIAAFKEFAKTNEHVKLYVAGDTPDSMFKAKLIGIVQQFNNKERICFLGMRNDISDLMASATALIVPSLHEGFGRITVEAMFNGCLVIGRDSAGTREILKKENLGILYDDQAGLIEAMRAVAENDISNYFELIEKARRRAIELYSQEQNVAAVERYYDEILKVDGSYI
ncbi:MAG: glycosyltransferase family 4 protein [Mucilaginibacter sp.]